MQILRSSTNLTSSRILNRIESVDQMESKFVEQRNEFKKTKMDQMKEKYKKMRLEKHNSHKSESILSKVYKRTSKSRPKANKSTLKQRIATKFKAKTQKNSKVRNKHNLQYARNYQSNRVQTQPDTLYTQILKNQTLVNPEYYKLSKFNFLRKPKKSSKSVKNLRSFKTRSKSTRRLKNDILAAQISCVEPSVRKRRGERLSSRNVVSQREVNFMRNSYDKSMELRKSKRFYVEKGQMNIVDRDH